jgi:pyruvate-formate lyase
MTARVRKQLEILQKREYRRLRSEKEIDITEQVAGKSRLQSDAIRLMSMLDHEVPTLFEDERIGFNRSLHHIPFYRDENGNRSGWSLGNITPNYGAVIQKGFDRILEEVAQRRAGCTDEQSDFLDAVSITLKSALRLADRYKETAKINGNTELYEALKQIPHNGVTSFYQACVFMKFIIFTLRCNANTHMTLGRFDQYMYPYYLHDINNGTTDDEILECMEEFFVSINIDTDLYIGVQQGDNGQSMVLGGCDLSGNDAFTKLSGLCLRASWELNLIDPKINLRVNKNTPLELYELGTKLTKQGLGFPQYSNDDIVIPGLVNLGYAYEDAVNYTVAACWEFIIPGCGMDIPNIATMNFPKVVNGTIHRTLLQCVTFEQLMEYVSAAIRAECDRLISASAWKLSPSPYASVFVDGCLEKAMDLSQDAAKYNNSGCHGAGISNAADALAAVKQMIFDENACDKQLLLNALDCNFEGYPELRHTLLNCPKMGNNDDFVDDIAGKLMDVFAKYLNGKKNNRGGIFRAGTGSAMEYINSAKEVGATADGRKANEPYGSSFSPAITTNLNGPLSVIQSFTKYDMKNIINGGPLTIEIHDTTFRNEDGVKKVAQLVKAFIDLGGHQLQINSINRERLLNAQKHPDKYPNLIVRVWGWSGYFNELDLPYQEHVIKRTEFCV